MFGASEIQRLSARGRSIREGEVKKVMGGREEGALVTKGSLGHLMEFLLLF